MLVIKLYSDFSEHKVLRDLDTLYSSIFQDDIFSYIKKVSAYPHLIILIAYYNEIAVGFKIGYSLPEQPDTLYSWAGGVLNEYRAQGIASALMTEQHKKSTAFGLKYIETKCRAKWAAMMSLNAKFGFKIVREYTGSCGTKKYLLRKPLGQTQSEPQH